MQSPRDDNERIDMTEVQQDVQSLYSSGQGRWGTDEDAFIKIITKHSNA